MKKYKVIKDGYQMFHTIGPECGMITDDTLNESMRHILVKGDVWIVCIDEETGIEGLYCDSGEWVTEDSWGKFDFEGLEHHFQQIIDEVECHDREEHNWVISEKYDSGSWSEAECTTCGLKKSNS